MRNSNSKRSFRIILHINHDNIADILSKVPVVVYRQISFEICADLRYTVKKPENGDTCYGTTNLDGASAKNRAHAVIRQSFGTAVHIHTRAGGFRQNDCRAFMAFAPGKAVEHEAGMGQPG
jgi:hypothetical protein